MPNFKELYKETRHCSLTLVSMKSKIDQYLNHTLAVNDLINNLERLLNQLTSIDPLWKKQFRINWLDIEVAYSIAIDQGLNQFDPESEKIVLESLNILRKMITTKLENIQNSENNT